ncbi:hypothetical protein SAMN05421819_2157 [Bryocella elongata]|uniref:Uncharacterized protein n=1 Tax=Bryocella elongata TaxID=863522 RepID=A0A1H5Y6Y5_9BACT|nr:hypothetical protein [Bryocella elongata]SEG19839.1 hypothetical protein SAMN05421819_2157 [Bryocella elongata]
MAESIGTGAARVAEVLLRTSGGRSVLLRMPAPAVSGDAGEQLGLATPLFQDAVLGPVAFRKADAATSEMLVSAEAMLRVAGTLAYDSVDALLQSAVGVVVDGVVWMITAVRTMQAEGKPYCYGVRMVKPVA